VKNPLSDRINDALQQIGPIQAVQNREILIRHQGMKITRAGWFHLINPAVVVSRRSWAYVVCWIGALETFCGFAES
jgi:hypothetical protein